MINSILEGYRNDDVLGAFGSVYQLTVFIKQASYK